MYEISYDTNQSIEKEKKYQKRIGYYMQGLHELSLDDVMGFSQDTLKKYTPANERYVQDLFLYTLQNMQIYIKTDIGRFATGMERKLYEMDKLLSAYRTQGQKYAKSA